MGTGWGRDMDLRWLILILLFPITVLADLPPQFPSLNRQVYVRTDHPVWPGRVWVKWQLDDGKWWCTYFNQKLPNASGWTAIDQYVMTMPAPSSLNWIERNFCFN